jgi:hypothetical protein
MNISNPLMVVRFALDRIRSFNRTNGEPSALTDPLRLAEQGERAIEAVIEDVRAMEQLRATGGKLAVLPVDLAGLTREALAMFGSRTAEKGDRSGFVACERHGVWDPGDSGAQRDREHSGQRDQVYAGGQFNHAADRDSAGARGASHHRHWARYSG